MADRNEAALGAAIKALEQAVQPAVDRGDPLAGEQLRLVVGYLRLMSSRLVHLEERARFEFEHYRELALALHDAALSQGGEVADRFDLALAQARESMRPGDVRAATAALAGAVSGLARAAVHATPEQRRTIEHAIAKRSRRWIDAQRAWFAPLGFELRPDQIPSLADALDISRVRA
ncbi:MAG: hypothetical protein IT499_02375 [Rubrivivax sp.]|nr:hypothetical protein [Rubrivivax sp.]